MSDVKKVQVRMEGPLGGDFTDEHLEFLGASVMEALIEAGAEDPFVSISGVELEMLVSLTVEAASGSEAISKGADLVDRAMKAAGYHRQADAELSASAKVLALA